MSHPTARREGKWIEGEREEEEDDGVGVPGELQESTECLSLLLLLLLDFIR